MTALNLLGQAVRLLVQNPLKTLKVVGPAVALLLLVSVLIALAAPELLTIGTAGFDQDAMTFGWRAGGLLAVFIVSYALMAILWHRFTLGHGTHAKPVSLPLLFGYLWRVGALALIQITVSLAVIVPLVIASQTADGDRPAVLSVLIATFMSQLLLVWLSLRLSLILPATAIGAPIRMRQSWDYTYSIARPLWSVAAALALINTSLRALVAFLDLENPLFVVALELPIYVIKGLLVLSILTTLYEWQVRKRGADAL
jgi:hypothetical protein